MKKTLSAVLGVFLALVTVITAIPFSVNAADDVELIGEVQGSVPDLYVSIDSGYSLDTIHKDKDAKIRTHVSVEGAWDDSFNFDSFAAEMKTRGNSTFDYDKKPYQIKFDSKTDMFGMGKAKKWVLLANYLDGSFVRNKIIFDLARNIGMPYTVKSVFVNLYINGSYKGLYQLCEKVEIGDNRIPLEDDFGVIAEMEAATRLAGEDFWFKTSLTGKPFVYKEYNTDFEEAPAEDVAAIRAFFEERINALEDELYNNGKDWEKVESLIDIDSVIQYYFINELSMNADATFASTYFYIDGKDDILHMGPVWDYDRSFGIYTGGNYEQGTSADFLKNIIDCSDNQRVEWYKMFFQYPEFCERVNKMYSEVIKDEFNADRIIATIDAYQSLLYDSLMMNYVDKGWVIFHTISKAEWHYDRESATEYLNFTTDFVKDNIRTRIAYLDTAYGEYHPTLSYCQNGGRTYTGGSMTDSQIMSTFKMTLDSQFDGSVSYSVMGSGISVSSAKDGEAVSGRGIYRIAVTLEGNVANYYSVQYRSFANGAWTSWVADGAQSGAGGRFNIERVQVRLVEKASVEFGTVSFDVESVEPISAIVGNKITLPELPEGVDGWYLDSALTGDPVTEVTVGEGTTLVYAKKTAASLEAGDLNGDGEVNPIDANVMKRIVTGVVTPTEAQMLAGDLDGDGAVTGLDSNLLFRVMAGIS